jgi:hypothetical protein
MPLDIKNYNKITLCVCVCVCVYYCCKDRQTKQRNETESSQVPVVAHAYNHSYSGGRDHEDCSSKPAWANSSQDPISKIPIMKRSGEVARSEDPEFKLQYCKKQNNKQTESINKFSYACLSYYKKQHTVLH